MTKQLLFAILCLLSITAAAQTTRKTVTPASYKGRQIIVGSGGGFTGRSISYYLLDDGKLFTKGSTDTDFTLLGVQTRANTSRVFSTLETACQIKTTQFNQPGNLYKFVRWKKGKQEFSVVWGDAQQKPPANFPKFYDSFMAMLRKK